MYLAPLNYDKYFKKVFSDTRIAKRFLEDFFDVTIQEITLMTVQHKVTDDAAAVEFDFRCKIDDHFVIIDMQQWFKPDVVHRFYTYHCLNTALQLENLPLKSILVKEGNKERKVKDYYKILPVITFVWLADDTFGNQEDYISYAMTPEIVVEFLNNNLLWQNQDITELLRQRELALKQLQKTTKQLDFLQKNKLIYAFQKNIVSNSKKENSKFHKYLAWFELAEKTKNKLNEKSDFLQYAEDDIFAEIIRRISKDTLSQEDYTYIDDQEQFNERLKRWEEPIYQDGMREGVKEGLNQAEKMIEEAKTREEEAKAREEEAKEQAEKERNEKEEAKLNLQIVKAYFGSATVESLAKKYDKTIEEIKKLVE